MRGPPVASVLGTKEDTRSLKLLWHAGRVAIRERRHFRCVYDVAERVYPGDVRPASKARDALSGVSLYLLDIAPIASNRHDRVQSNSSWRGSKAEKKKRKKRK